MNDILFRLFRRKCKQCGNKLTPDMECQFCFVLNEWNNFIRNKQIADGRILMREIDNDIRRKVRKA